MNLRLRFAGLSACDCACHPRAEYPDNVSDPWRTQAVVPGYLLNEGDSFSRQLGTAASKTGFEFPQGVESLVMPARQGLWLEDQQGLFPM